MNVSGAVARDGCVCAPSRGAAFTLAMLMIAGSLVPGPSLRADSAPARSSALDPFVSRLVASGRATVRIQRRVLDATGGNAVRGRLMLEPPDRARLDFDRTGEQVALRADGGEWLQPALRQCVKLGPARARVALEWWDLFMTPQRERFIERKLPGGRVLIVRSGADASADSAWVTLRHELPTVLEIAEEGGPRSTYDFSDWKFSKARGRAEFVLTAPPGWESVELP